MDLVFDDLYDMGCSFEPGSIVVIGSRPAMGKTILALNILLDLQKGHKKCTYITLSEGTLQVNMKLISNMSKVDMKNILQQQAEAEEVVRIQDADKLLKEFFKLDRLSVLDIEDLEDRDRSWLPTDKKIYSLLSDKKLQGSVVFIDYYQLIAVNNDLLMTNLNEIAKKNNICLVLLSQLNMDCDGRTGHRPVLTDLAHPELGELADCVLLPFRREYYDPMDKPGMLELIVAKNRRGNTGSIKYVFRREICSVGKYTPID